MRSCKYKSAFSLPAERMRKATARMRSKGIFTPFTRHRVDVGIMSQMVLWVHPIITGYQKTCVFQRKGVNQAYVVLRVVMVR